MGHNATSFTPICGFHQTRQPLALFLQMALMFSNSVLGASVVAAWLLRFVLSNAWPCSSASPTGRDLWQRALRGTPTHVRYWNETLSCVQGPPIVVRLRHTTGTGTMWPPVGGHLDMSTHCTLAAACYPWVKDGSERISNGSRCSVRLNITVHPELNLPRRKHGVFPSGRRNPGTSAGLTGVGASPGYCMPI